MDKNRTRELACSLTDEELATCILVASAKFRANSTNSKSWETSLWETNLLTLALQKIINPLTSFAKNLLRFPYWSFPAQFAFVYSILFVAVILILPVLQRFSPYILFIIYIWLLNALLYGTKPLQNRMMKR